MGTLPPLPQFLPSHNTETEAQHREPLLFLRFVHKYIWLSLISFFPKRKSNLVTFLLF